MPTFNPDNVLVKDSLQGQFTGSMAEQVIEKVAEESVVTRLGQYVEMDGKQKITKPVYLDTIGAYWVGETEKIQTSKPEIRDITLEAHKIGVIVPASREFLTYTWTDFFDEVKDDIAKAFLRKFDDEVLNGTNKIFANSIASALEASGHVVEGDLTFENILAVEDHLYDAEVEPKAFISNVTNTSALRTAVDERGNSVFERNTSIDGLPYVNSSAVDRGELIVGDFDKLLYGVPYSIEFEVSKEAQLSTITNEDGSPVNLFEQDMLALRATIDVAALIIKEDAFAAVQSGTPEI